jgi:hypothetical protein
MRCVSVIPAGKDSVMAVQTGWSETEGRNGKKGSGRVRAEDLRAVISDVYVRAPETETGLG